MKKNELIYLACPYSNKDAEIQKQRFLEVNRVAAKLMLDGYYLFSPISHTHPIAEAGSLPRGWQYWEGYDREMIKHCKCLVVVLMDGWKESTGVQAEIKIAEEMGIPIEYLHPTEIL